jgi:hypothetical protein
LLLALRVVCQWVGTGPSAASIYIADPGLPGIRYVNNSGSSNVVLQTFITAGSLAGLAVDANGV